MIWLGHCMSDKDKDKEYIDCKSAFITWQNQKIMTSKKNIYTKKITKCQTHIKKQKQKKTDNRHNGIIMH